MALDFPGSPATGTTYTGPGGVIWVWDSQKWVSGTLTTGIYAPINSVPNINYADNTGFAVNQRVYVSGTALAAGIYGHDRWKAGAGGCTYTFAAPAGPANTITITAGTLQQVIEGLSIAGGNYMLSWTGTAQGRVGAGSYTASPVSVAGITAGTNTTIEFNTGTLGQVKFEAGTIATPWQAQPAQQDLAKCQRFYCRMDFNLGLYGAAASQLNNTFVLPVAMRAVPGTVALVGASNTNSSGGTGSALGPSSVLVYYTVTAAGIGFLSGGFTASADL